MAACPKKMAGNFIEITRCRACCCFATCCKCTASALCGPSSQATFCGVNVVNTSVLLIKMILHFCMCPAVLEGSTLGISPLHSGCIPGLATTTAPWSVFEIPHWAAVESLHTFATPLPKLLWRSVESPNSAIHQLCGPVGRPICLQSAKKIRWGHSAKPTNHQYCKFKYADQHCRPAG